MINKIPLLEDFVEYKRALNIREKTISEYTDAVDKFISFYLEYADKNHLTRHSYKTITTQDMQTYLFKLRDNLSIASTRKYLSGVSQFFNWLMVNKYIDTNPLNGVQMQKNTEKQERHIMTYEQAMQIIEHAQNDRYKLMLSMMGFMGMRIEEICNLQIKNFNFEDNTVYFIRKGGKWQTLPIRKHLIDLLKKEIESVPSNQVYLFQSSNKPVPMTTNAIRTMFIKTREIALVDCEYKDEFTPHHFRYAVATHLFQDKGYNIQEVQLYLAHNSELTTQKYLHLNNSKTLDKFARMDD